MVSNRTDKILSPRLQGSNGKSVYLPCDMRGLATLEQSDIQNGCSCRKGSKGDICGSEINESESESLHNFSFVFYL